MKYRLPHLTIVAFIAALAACGGGGGDSPSSGNDGRNGTTPTLPTGMSAVVLSGGASSSLYLHTKNGTTHKSLKDASSQSTATGAGSGIVSLGDNASTTCAFTFDSTSNSTGISIVASGHALDCSNANKCIVCTTGTSGANCSINCSGIVPSNFDTAHDTFNIYVHYTSDLQTNMPNAGGMVRFDALATSWDEFLMSDGNGNPNSGMTNDTSGCLGGAGLIAVPDDGNGHDQATYFVFDPHDLTVGWDIVGVTPDNNGFSTCTMITKLKAAMPLTGADTPGATIDLTRGTVQFRAEICDLAGTNPSDTTCPGPS